VVATAWLAHLYTASGALCAFLALTRIFDGHYREAFLWLAVALIVDATDGVLARRMEVALRLPGFNGAKLDDLVDYLTYVFVPAILVWHVPLVPERWTIPLAAAMLLSSAYGFNRDDAKTGDHFFTGFPSYWNIVAFYLYQAGWSPVVNGLILLGFVALVFVPIRYIYPTRTPAWRPLTIAGGALWGVLMLVMVWRMPDVSRPLFWASLAFPVYYFGLSLLLEFKRRRP
jgi:phosphatidylcholine synthase